VTKTKIKLITWQVFVRKHIRTCGCGWLIKIIKKVWSWPVALCCLHTKRHRSRKKKILEKKKKKKKKKRVLKVIDRENSWWKSFLPPITVVSILVFVCLPWVDGCESFLEGETESQTSSAALALLPPDC
jgi:hypothetical protein